MTYISQHFKPYELLPKATYIELELNNKLHYTWLLFDNRVLKTLDILREVFGITHMNDWFWNGNNQYKGWRPSNCIGAKYSQHKFGRAADPTFKNVEAEFVRNYVFKNRDKFPYITAIEMNIPWFHFATQNNNSKEIIKIYP